MGGSRPLRDHTHVTIIALLAVVGLVQGVFLLGIVVLLVGNRRRAAARRIAQADIAAAMRGPVRRWLVGEGSVEDVARRLDELPVNCALEQALVIATSRAAVTQRAELSQAIAGSPWVAAVMARARSRRWWRRLDAARLLAIVGGPRDRDLLRALLHDPHPAVRGIATASIPAVGDLDTVAQLLDALPDQPLVVRLYQFSVLRDTWWLATPALIERLRPDAPAARLDAWINLAESIATADVLEQVRQLHGHPDAGVRLAVARALKRYFHPLAEEALVTLLGDADWRVRALAARSLGTLGDASTVPRLATLLGDGQWWVRFRAGLALAQLGEAGRAALRAARADPDRYAAEMATMVSGLSPGSVVELAEG